ncbi:MAG: hypothetical protein ACREXY_08405 [Gammaproteobacteria bacterium]
MEAGGIAQLPQSQIIFLGQQSAYLALVSWQDHGFSAGQVVPWSNVSSVSTLLQELLDHAQGDAETLRNLFAGALLMIVGAQNSFPKIQRQRSHARRAIRAPRQRLHYLLKCSSPGLRGTSYPGKRIGEIHQPQRGCVNSDQ